MSIDVKRLSDAELSDLIIASMQEWAQRQAPAEATVEIRRPAPEVVKTHIIDVPSEADRQFILAVGEMLRKRATVIARDRARYREIAARYPEWVKRQGLPDDPGGSTGRDWKRYNVDFAGGKERW